MPDMREQLDEGIRYERAGALDLALAAYVAVAAEADEPALVAEALRRQSGVHRARCDWDAALSGARAAAKCAKSAGLPHLFAEAMNAEGLIHQSRGHFAEASEIYHRILRDPADERMRGIVLQNLGSIAAAQGQFGRAEHLFHDSAACFERAGYERGRVIALTNGAAAALDARDFEHARGLGEAAVEAARALGDLELLGIAKLNYAEALVRLGQHEPAESVASAALGHFSTVSNTWRCVQCLRLLAEIFEARGAADTAERAVRRALEMARSIGADVETRQLEEKLSAIAGGPA